MCADALFRPLDRVGACAAPAIPITFNGRPLQVPPAASVAAALLSAGVKRFRNSPVSGRGRAPYCMMGVCFECLLEIDGVPNRQGCLVPLAAGMSIRTQDGLPDLASDLGTDDSPDGLTQAMEAPRGA